MPFEYIFVDLAEPAVLIEQVLDMYVPSSAGGSARRTGRPLRGLRGDRHAAHARDDADLQTRAPARARRDRRVEPSDPSLDSLNVDDALHAGDRQMLVLQMTIASFDRRAA